MSVVIWLIAALMAVVFSFLSTVYLINRYSESNISVRNIQALSVYIKRRKIIFYFSFTVVLSLFVFFIANLNHLSVLQCYRNLVMILWIVPIALIDYKEKVIPNLFIVIGLGFWLVLFLMEWLIGHNHWLNILQFSLFGLLLGGGTLLISFIVARNSIGMGDIKMFSVIGLIYGFSSTFSIMIVALFVMMIVGIMLLIRKKVDKKAALPMAPFAAIGMFVGFLFGL